MDDEDGVYASPAQPVFIIVEAKRTSKLSDSSSLSELFGQIKSELIRRYISRLFILHSLAKLLVRAKLTPAL